MKSSILKLLLAVVAMPLASPAGGADPSAASTSETRKRPAVKTAWMRRVLAVPRPDRTVARRPTLQLLRQDHESLQLRRSVIRTPLRIGERTFTRGLGTHSVGHIRIRSPVAIERFGAHVGVDRNDRTAGGSGSVVFVVRAGRRELLRTKVLRGGSPGRRVDLAVGGAKALDLHVLDAGDGPACDHADWADAAVTLKGGKKVFLDELKFAAPPTAGTRYPFSFLYAGRPSDGLLDAWPKQTRTRPSGRGRSVTDTTWRDPKTGLSIRCQVTRFGDFPAVEWVLYFENTAKADTAILSDVQALDVTFDSPRSGAKPYLLHRTNGAPSKPTDFESQTVAISAKRGQSLGGGGGRSSNRDFPFFKIDSARGSAVVAVGWSGQWLARLDCPDNKHLRLRAGQERTHFLLHPGERVRTPRVLLLFWEGDSPESNARFRQLIYKHYCAPRAGKAPLPTLYCNTCFTRGGGWLNECNAANQISLIHAYAPLGLEALLTDAGWFEGGWPAGAGNWTPRKDAYPRGMGPVAAAAKARGMTYGLWFEPERVMAGTWLHKNRPQWLLTAGKGPQRTFLLNFGLQEVRDHFFGIVKGFMDLPGFGVYRQDFNMDPLAYWRHNDPANRQGVTEMKYVEGLYAYWDRIAAAWPKGLRIECSSGGRRIDLETVRRMHVHQKSDYWFDNEVDQSSIFGLSQYLPNNVFMAPVNRMDDYSFHSALATSLCMGWIADAKDFDAERGKKLLDTYRRLRHLLIGAWYPLTAQNRDRTHWLAVQFHRSDLDEGMILAFRRDQSPYPAVDVSLRGLDARATYELSRQGTDKTRRVKGAELMKSLRLELPRKHSSALITYRKASGR